LTDEFVLDIHLASMR